MHSCATLRRCLISCSRRLRLWVSVGASLLTMAFVATFVDETAGLNLDKLEPSEPNALCSRLGLCTMGDSERPPPESPPVHVRDGAAPPRRRTTQRHSNSGYGAATTEPLLA